MEKLKNYKPIHNKIGYRNTIGQIIKLVELQEKWEDEITEVYEKCDIMISSISWDWIYGMKKSYDCLKKIAFFPNTKITKVT